MMGLPGLRGHVVDGPGDVRHGRPEVGPVVEAERGDDGELVERPAREAAAQRRVGQPAVHLAHVAEVGPGPVQEAPLVAGVGVEGPAAGDELQEHHAEAVDVGLDGEAAGERVVGRAVAQGAHHARGHVGVVAGGPDPGQPQVGQLGGEVVGQEDVGRLQVAVDHRRRHRLV
uniref:Uncharacterized protein n=1 Tax=Triticum urartu TaxID=4572 RepID=A0A8R7UZJ4_TRIUA